MARSDLFIAGDWGTSVLRLYLCSRAGGPLQVLESVRGPGVKDTRDFEETLFATAEPLLGGKNLPIMLGGMVGSTIGWRECPYVACPAGPAELAAGVLRFRARGSDIAIAPGLRCSNIFGLPDVMRGEEVQVAGFLQQVPHRQGEQRLICLPGTHAKWVSTDGQTIKTFFTSMQGELHDLLLRHSLLGRTIGPGASWETATDPETFSEGVGLMLAEPMLSLQHAIFSMRSRVVLGVLEASLAASFLSGILIGADIRDALAAQRAQEEIAGPIVLIGAEHLVDLYARAIEQGGGETLRVSDRQASIAGLAALIDHGIVVA